MNPFHPFFDVHNYKEKMPLLSAAALHPNVQVLLKAGLVCLDTARIINHELLTSDEYTAESTAYLAMVRRNGKEALMVVEEVVRNGQWYRQTGMALPPLINRSRINIQGFPNHKHVINVAKKILVVLEIKYAKIIRMWGKIYIELDEIRRAYLDIISLGVRMRAWDKLFSPRGLCEYGRTFREDGYYHGGLPMSADNREEICRRYEEEEVRCTLDTGDAAVCNREALIAARARFENQKMLLTERDRLNKLLDEVVASLNAY